MKGVLIGSCTLGATGLVGVLIALSPEHELQPITVSPPPFGKKMGRQAFVHGGAITYVEFASNDRILSIGAGGTRLWDAQTGTAIARPKNVGGFLCGKHMVAVSPPDGRNRPSTIKVWRCQDLTLRHSIDVPGSFLRSTATHDGTLLAAWNHQGEFLLIDAATGRMLDQRKLLGSDMARLPVRAAFARDGSYLMVHCTTDLRFFPIQNRKQIGGEFKHLKFPGYSEIRTTGDPDLLLLMPGNRLSLYRLSTGQFVTHFKADAVSSLGADVSPDFSRVATCGLDSAVSVWDFKSGNRLWKTDTGERFPFAVAFSPDGRRVVSGGRHGVVRVWDAQTGKELHLGPDKPPPPPSYPAQGTIVAIAVSPDGKQIAAGRAEGGVTVFDCESGQRIAVFNDEMKSTPSTADVHPGRRFVAYSPDGKLLLSGTGRYQPGAINVWDAETLTLQRTVEGHGRRVRCLAVSPDGRNFASAGSGTLRVWTIGGRLRHETNWRGVGLAFSMDSKRLINAGGPEICVLDAANGKTIATLKSEEKQENVINTSVTDAAFGADANTLVSSHSVGLSSGLKNDVVRVWSISDAAVQKSIRLDGGRWGIVEGAGHRIAVSPDGRILAAAARECQVGLWDLSTGKPLGKVGRHRDPVTSVVWWPDGQAIVTAGVDQMVCVWDVRALLPNRQEPSP